MDDLQQRWDALDGPVVRVEQISPTPPAEVCAAWLDADRLAQWWWPQWPDTTYEIDAREGGGYRFHSAAADFGVHGTILRIGPQEDPELWMTWNWDIGAEQDGPEELVRVRFEEHEGGTNVVMEHRLARAGEDTANPTQGWTDVMSRLA